MPTQRTEPQIAPTTISGYDFPIDPWSDPRLHQYRALPPKEYAALGSWMSTFYPFQRNWLFEKSRLAISNKARQIGLSHTSGGCGVLWGAYHGEMTTIISISKPHSEEIIKSCMRHVNILQQLGSDCASMVKSNMSEIVFASGGRILALPSSGGRGFTGNVILDEYAYQQHATEVWDRAAPVAMHGYKIRVLSTPNGIGNEFNDLWEIATNPDRRKNMAAKVGGLWKPHEIPIELAIAQGFPVDMKTCWEMAKGDPRLFAQMFNCSFLDNVLQYIPNEIIQTCAKSYNLTVPAEGEFYGGLDIGREADLTCLVILYRLKNVNYVVHVETMKRTDSDGLEAMVDRAFARYKLRRLCIDATGLGTFPAERIKKKHSERVDVSHRRPRVEPITFTPLNKEALATGLYTAMTSLQLILPADDQSLPQKSGVDTTSNPGQTHRYIINEHSTARKLKKEIASIRRVISTSGNVQYTTPRTNDGHADRAWATMLALHARSTTNPMIDALRSRLAG